MKLILASLVCLAYWLPLSLLGFVEFKNNLIRLDDVALVPCYTSPWFNGINPRDSLMPKDGDDGFFPTTGNELKPEALTSNCKYRVRVLVCAPSNSALDEIVLRVFNGGIHDENDRVYCPKIVRIGLKAHHSIKAVSLDELASVKEVIFYFILDYFIFSPFLLLNACTDVQSDSDRPHYLVVGTKGYKGMQWTNPLKQGQNGKPGE
ncbi:hypothetical protein JHK85_013099 [Glycine max]|nr:hypothetical protein JHK85_013099 [Glycine max]